MAEHGASFSPAQPPLPHGAGGTVSRATAPEGHVGFQSAVRAVMCIQSGMLRGGSTGPWGEQPAPWTWTGCGKPSAAGTHPALGGGEHDEATQTPTSWCSDTAT